MRDKIFNIKDYLIYGLGQIINLIAPLLVAPRIIQISGLNNWGKVGIATSVFTIVSIIIDFGSNIIGVREISIHKNDFDKTKEYLKKTYNLRIILFSAIALLFIPTVMLVGLNTKMYLFGFFFLFAQMFNPIWYFQGIQDFSTINKIIIFSKALYVLIVYFVLTKCDDYIYLILVLGISNCIFYYYYFSKIMKKFQIKVLDINKQSTLQIIRKEYPVVVSNLSISLYINTPIIIIGYLLNDYFAGIYKIGEMILLIYRSYLSVFFNVSFPKFCSKFALKKKDGENFLKKINTLNIIMLIISILVINITYFCFKEYFNISKSLEVSLNFALYFLGLSIIIAINIPFYQTLIYYNKQKGISNIAFTAALLMFVVCYFLTQKMQIKGSLIAVYLCETFVTCAIIIYYYRVLKKIKKT